MTRYSVCWQTTLTVTPVGALVGPPVSWKKTACQPVDVGLSPDGRLIRAEMFVGNLRRKETATSGDIALVAEDAKDQRAAPGEAAASASQPSSTTGWGTAHDVRRAAEAKSASSPLHPFPTAYVITEPRVAYRFNLGD